MYQFILIGISIIMLTELPIAWVLLKRGYPPYAAMWPSLLSYSVALFFRFHLIHRYVEGYNYKDYFQSVVLRCLLVSTIAYLLCCMVSHEFSSTFVDFVSSSLLYVLISLSIIALVGMKKSERLLLFSKVRDFVVTKFS